ncbi:hypothetical protein [Paenibacillus ginsengihumi]|uniref:hypothetical protein n=1 Tax=Paenibacillus ginsengihumi TaxID=431596 RepID=UPI0012EC5321
MTKEFIVIGVYLEKLDGALRRIIKRDAHEDCAAPSEDENGQRTLGNFRGESANVVFCTTKTGGYSAFAAQCCKKYNISGDVPGFEANLAQIVARNTTFPFLWCEEARNCCTFCRIRRLMRLGCSRGGAETQALTSSSNAYAAGER